MGKESLWKPQVERVVLHRGGGLPRRAGNRAADAEVPGGALELAERRAVRGAARPARTPRSAGSRPADDSSRARARRRACRRCARRRGRSYPDVDARPAADGGSPTRILAGSHRVGNWSHCREARPDPESAPAERRAARTGGAARHPPAASARRYREVMRDLYPEIEPLETGMLDVGDGQHIYWEVSGNREGKPVVFLHGGPGARHEPRRTAGSSTRSGTASCCSTSAAADSRSRTQRARRRPLGEHDLAPRRRHGAAARAPRHRPVAGVRRVVGQHARARLRPDASRARDRARAARHLHAAPPGARLVLRGRRVGDVPRPVGGVRRARSAVPSAAHLIEAYGRLLADPDPEVHEPAAIAWSRWEASTITLLPQADTIARFTDARVRDGVRAHREPLLPPRRLVGGGPADPRRLAARAASRP